MSDTPEHEPERGEVLDAPLSTEAVQEPAKVMRIG